MKYSHELNSTSSRIQTLDLVILSEALTSQLPGTEKGIEEVVGES